MIYDGQKGLNRAVLGSEGLSLLPEISLIEDIEKLRKILEGIKTVSTIKALQHIYRNTTDD